jgi:hypothetical protein
MIVIKGDTDRYSILDMSPEEASHFRNILRDRKPGIEYLLALPDQQLKVQVHIKSDFSATAVRQNMREELAMIKNMLEQFKKYE